MVRSWAQLAWKRIVSLQYKSMARLAWAFHTWTEAPPPRRNFPIHAQTPSIPPTQKGLDRLQTRQTRPSTSARNGQRHTTVEFTTTSQPSPVAPQGHLRHVPYGPSFPFEFPFHWKPLKGNKVAFEREAEETKGKVGREQAHLGRDARRKRHVDGSAATERSYRLMCAFCASRSLLPGHGASRRVQAASITDGEPTWDVPPPRCRW